MKKFITTLLSIIMIMAIVSCGGSGDDSSSDKSTEEDTTKIEKNIDATAEALGLTAGDETYYQLIGAKAGKQYNDGAIELYQFDENSDEYKEIESTKTVANTNVSAYKDGIVMLFVGTEEDQNIIDKFNKLEYK